MDNVGVVIFGLTGWFVGCYKFGRWSVNHKVIELEKCKETLILSRDNHEELINEIDDKIKEIEVFNNLSIWNRKKE
tara:strand:- start:158 stop:385 length:228 start_codon:yes stop_codon:yes gene_type:complete